MCVFSGEGFHLLVFDHVCLTTMTVPEMFPPLQRFAMYSCKSQVQAEPMAGSNGTRMVRVMMSSSGCSDL